MSSGREREIKKATKKSDVHSAAELFSGMTPLEIVEALLSLTVKTRRKAARTPMECRCEGSLWNSQMRSKSK